METEYWDSCKVNEGNLKKGTFMKSHLLKSKSNLAASLEHFTQIGKLFGLQDNID